MLARAIAFGLALIAGLPAAAAPDAPRLYREHCAQCHGEDRLGATGPALIPEALVRVRKEQAASVVATGREATQMPGFKDRLGEAEIAALVGYVYSPLAHVPSWGEKEIEASRVVLARPPALDRPTFAADPLNLFVVVETGDHHATILDGDRLEPITRFPTRFALHGGPKFTPDGRFVFFASRDGWVTKYDLWNLAVVAEVRAGLNTRNIALSKDGRHVAVANYLPHSLVMLSAEDLSVEKSFEVADRAGQTSRVSAVYQNHVRNSFIAALKDVPELWEVSTDPDAPPVYGAFVHSRQPGLEEGIPESPGGLFARRRITLAEPLDDFYFAPDYISILGASRDGSKAVVVDLDVGKAIADVALPGMPHLGSGIAWDWQGRKVMATPHLKDSRLSIISLGDWKVVRSIETKGAGFFLRSHEGSRYAWADAMMSREAKDTMQLIDKETLEVAHVLRPAPGKTAAHTEFDRYGRYALVSIWEKEGALVVYDAATLAEVKRIPMSKPSGKYNVYNKITFSEGTSH
ncbi:MAG: cytochrome D1 domain-containing protein [Pseudomonadota bacterium]